MKNLGRSACFAALAALWASAACEKARPPLSGDDLGIPAATPDAGPVSHFGDQPSAPSCDGGLGTVCGCLELTFLRDPPNLYFVLDRSGSMVDDDKWTTVRIVAMEAIRKLGPRIRVGAAVFPAPLASGCVPGVEVMAVRAGDSPGAQLGTTTRMFIESVNLVALGGTPTAATLRALRPNLTALPGRTYVILATDGGPNCNGTTMCGASLCIPNIEGAGGCALNGPSCCTETTYGPFQCLDESATVSAVASLQAAGIDVYVIGVPGSGPYASVLNEVARAGGTARSGDPAYYRVDSAGTTAFAAALSEVAAKITATCQFDLASAPPDPGLVNVYLDGKVVPQDPVDGWRLDGAQVNLLGAACDRVLRGDALDVRVVAGCPTLIR